MIMNEFDNKKFPWKFLTIRVRLFFFTILLSTYSPLIAFSATYYISNSAVNDGDGSSTDTPWRNSIQEAIQRDDVMDGDIIYVKEGTYRENIDIDKSVTIQADKSNSAPVIIIAAERNDHIFDIKVNGVTIDGFTIYGAVGCIDAACDLPSAGLFIGNDVSECTLRNNQCGTDEESNGIGIFLSRANNNIIQSNSCYNNLRTGIWLNSSTGNTISHNFCFENLSYGIRLSDTQQNQLENNDCSRNSRGGILMETSRWDNLIKNTCESNVSSVTGQNEGFGIRLSQSRNVTIHQNICSSNNGSGVYLELSEFNTVSNNTFEGNQTGIYLNVSSNNNIYRNNFLDNQLHLSSLSSSNQWHTTAEVLYLYNAEPVRSYLGNYYADYTTTDMDADGISDVPYLLYQSETETVSDNYTLVSESSIYETATCLIDSDGDGSMDCEDDCPYNESIVTAGETGCERAEDMDNDNAPNSIGACTEGVDTDKDGVDNCQDACPNDPNKIEKGKCGCGVAEGSCGNTPASSESVYRKSSGGGTCFIDTL